MAELKRAALQGRAEKVDKLAAALLKDCWLAFPELGIEAEIEKAGGPALAAQREAFAADAAAAREQFEEVERGLAGS